LDSQIGAAARYGFADEFDGVSAICPARQQPMREAAIHFIRVLGKPARKFSGVAPGFARVSGGKQCANLLA
jgi:hypothetical protein